ncbi:unnamed protein product [Pneumocystis jirovecii]|uniref:Uncharacterized protein n=1 Tax=Pneumocystis jirovecii TaxID=42068 RepID=L0P906_PNEJI|nr:unnamed protein product [Pneumocystis jirovecii]
MTAMLILLKPSVSYRDGSKIKLISKYFVNDLSRIMILFICKKSVKRANLYKYNKSPRKSNEIS